MEWYEDPVYIKMVDCPEIQEQRLEEAHKDTGKWKAGDYYVYRLVIHTVFIVPQYLDAWADEPDYLHHPHENIWLPTQAQLQAMVPTKVGRTQPNCKMISELNHFYDYWDTNGIPNFLTTWGQLWLAFVLKKKWNKVWSGSVWVKC